MNKEKLEEMRRQLDRLNNERESQIKKMNILIGAASSITILFTIFATLIIADLPNTGDTLYWGLVSLLVGEIFLSSTSIMICVWSFKVRSYRDPMVGVRLEENESTFRKNLINGYAISIEKYCEENEKQAKQINRSRKFFIVTLITLPCFVLITLFAIPLNQFPMPV